MAHPGQNSGYQNGRYLARGPTGEKRCRRCLQMQPIDSFVADRSRFDGRGYVCASCRDKARKMPGPTIRERRALAVRGNAWCAGCQAWKDSDSVRGGRCQPCINEYTRRRYAANPDFRERRRNRSLARKRGIDPVPTAARVMLLEDFDGTCAYCPAKATTFDHVVAFKKGGLTEAYNIVPACCRCNSSKRTQNVWAWIGKTGRAPQAAFFDRIALYHASMIPPDGPDPFE